MKYIFIHGRTMKIPTGMLGVPTTDRACISIFCDKCAYSPQHHNFTCGTSRFAAYKTLLSAEDFIEQRLVRQLLE